MTKASNTINYNYEYRIEPIQTVQTELERQVNACQQVYNHYLYELRNTDEYLSYTAMHGMLPDIKYWWDDPDDVYSRVLQMVARHVSDNLDRLKKERYGRKVGMLNWKSPREYRSLVYNQSGFKLKNISDQTILSLSKIGEMSIHLHRGIHGNVRVKQVTIRREKTGEWCAIFGIEIEDDVPENPNLDEVDREGTLDIIKYAHDTDSMIVGSLDLESEYERIEREQRTLSRKQEGSQSWYEKRRDFCTNSQTTTLGSATSWQSKTSTFAG